MRHMIFATALVAVAMSLATPAQAASFNCNYARLPDEVAICQSPTLSALDEEMASAYFRVLNSLRAQGLWYEARALRRSQRRWLRRRHACGYNFGCIRRKIRQRINYLYGWM